METSLLMIKLRARENKNRLSSRRENQGRQGGSSQFNRVSFIRMFMGFYGVDNLFLIYFKPVNVFYEIFVSSVFFGLQNKQIILNFEKYKVL